MNERTIRHLTELERDFAVLEGALCDLQQRLSALPVPRASAAARDVRKAREGLRMAPRCPHPQHLSP
jgi:hypothetical protein